MSTVRRCPAGTVTVNLRTDAPSTPAASTTLASLAPGFWRVMYSWKPAWVEPSANDHRVRGAWAPRTVWLPLTAPMGKSRWKYIDRSATSPTGDWTPTDTPLRPKPAVATTSTVVRPCAGTTTDLGVGADPSS